MTVKRGLRAQDLLELDTLLSSTGHKLITAASDPVRYERCIERWSLAAVKPAGAVLVPEDVESVAIAVRYATDNAIDLAVRGGGHSTAGTSSTDRGLLIDLGSSQRFTRVEVDRTNNYIVAGGGANWGNVDKAGFAAGLAAVGGTVHDTGIGGLTLGGGYGWLSGKVGLTIDNLVSVQLVTADGTVLTVSRDENPELFWGLRGAGHNFGVAVQFVYQGHAYGTGPVEKRIGGAEGGQAWAGTLLYSMDKLSGVLHLLNKYFGPGGTLLGGTAAGGFALARQPPASDLGPIVIIVPVVWLSDEESGVAAFKELLDLEPTKKDLKMMDYPGLNRIFQFEPKTRVSLKGSAFKLPIREEFARKLVDSLAKFTQEVPDAAGSVVQFDLLDMTKIATIASNRDMAFSNRGYHLNGAAEVFWHSADNDKACRQWARDISDIFSEELRRGNGKVTNGDKFRNGKDSENDSVLMYGNLEQYGETAQNVFGANFPRLQELKAHYDPKNTFDKNYKIQPKL